MDNLPTWLLAPSVLLLIIGVLLAVGHANTFREETGPCMDRRPPKRWSTLLLPILVLALLAVVVFFLGAAVRPEHPPLAHVPHGPGGMRHTQLLTWGVLALAVIGPPLILVAPVSADVLEGHQLHPRR